MQALTSYYLGTLSDELCACGLHALALPVETLRLMAAECLLQSVSASQLVHLRYSYNVSFNLCSVVCEGNRFCVCFEPCIPCTCRLVSLCTAIGAHAPGEEHRKEAGLVYLNAEDLAR